MKPKSISRFAGLQSIRTLALVTTITAFAAGGAFAATYQWTGTTDSVWTTATNWTAVGVAPTGTVSTPLTASHRLNVNNAAASKAVYTAAFGTTTYANASGRGLVIGSGALGSGTLEITGGTFSTFGSTGGDAISNQDNATGRLIINGGNYIGTNAGTGIGIGGGTNRTGILDILAGNATCATLDMNTNSATINLDGGTLAVNKITNAGNTGILNFNGGTLKARQNEPAFVAGLSGVFVKSNGAIIDTDIYNVVIGNVVRTDTVSLGGGITKNGTGLLTLSALSTTTGAANITNGGLAVVAGTLTDSWKPTSFTHSGNLLNFNVGVLNPLNLAAIDTTAGTGTVTFNSPITVNVTGSQFVVGQIPLIKYDGATPGKLTGFSNLDLNEATLPVGVLATLVNDGNGLIYLDVTQAATIFTWSAGTGDWDTNPATLNWNNNTTAYSTSNAQLAIFPNITNGGTVNVTDTFSPVQLEINNTSPNDYLFEGTGGISGSGKLIKSGTGVAAFSTTNTYSGGTTVSAGTLTFLKKAALPATGSVEAAAAATVALGVGGTGDYFSGTDVVSLLAGTLPGVSGTNTYTVGIDTTASDFDLTEALGTSTRALVKRGANTLTLSGSNGFDKTITVVDGTLKAGGASAFTGTGGLALSGTSAFDMNGFDVSITSLAAGSSGSSITTNATGTGTEVDTLSITGGTTSFLGEVLDGSSSRKIALKCMAANASNVPDNANNTYSGGLTLQGDATTGVRMLPSASATNVDGNGVVLNGPYGTGPITIGEDPTQKAQIYFNAANRVIANDIIVNTTLATDVGNSIRLESLGNTISGAIIANQASLTFGSNWAPFGGAGSVTLSGPISTGDNPAAGLAVGSDGLSMVVTLANPNTTPNSYTGNTVIRGGACVLKLGNNDQIPNGADKGNVSMTIDFNSGRYGNLDLNGFSETINGLSGNGRVDNIAATTPSVLTLGDNDATATFGGGIRNTAALTSPAAKVSLVKIGSGTQTLGSLTTTHSCGITLDSATVTIGSTVALAPGMLVTGTGIPADTTILAVINATSFTLSQNASATNATAALSFTNTNSYTGTTSIQAGTLALGATGTIDTSSAVSIAAGAVLETTAKTNYAIPASQTVTFALNGADAGSSGQINAAGLDITNATVAFNISGPLNDAAYVLATYGAGNLTGTAFLSVPTVSGYTLDYAYNGGTQIALVQSAAAGYASWASTNLVLEGENGDDDKDGIINLVEYALGLNPQVGNPAPGTFSGNTLTYNKGSEANAADDVTYTIETSTSLQTGSWTNAVVAAPEDNSISFTLPSNQPGGKLFGRLKVTKP